MANPQDPTQRPEQTPAISRRDFIHSLAASGAGLMLSQLAFAQTPTSATALAINRAVETGERIRFNPEDFQVV